MVVRMRHTRAHTANRRSHHRLTAPRLAKCADCGAMHVPHRVCMSCGKYRGRVVIDVAGAALQKAKKRAASKSVEAGSQEK
jgi:large subunit ribosomal protein L32